MHRHRGGFFFGPISNQIRCKKEDYLSSCVYDMAIIFSSFINDTLHIGGFDGRIIRINKMVLERMMIILSFDHLVLEKSP